tara:strand:+ start:5075 stop:6430 length:1356 start_codon:yes stop_codon:yes gene_type:complete
MANPKSQQFKLTKAHITADRFGGFDTKFFDVKNQVAEINIYESIEEPSLSGTIAILDDKSLYELINFNGTERIRLEMAGLGKETDPVFEKTFIMTNIIRQIKGNDKSSMYVFDLIDEHGFISQAERLRSAYRGRIDDIVKGICLTQLKKSVDISYQFLSRRDRVDAIQDDIRVIIPNLSPINAIKWLLSRATTQTGSPFFLWASIHDENLRMGNLDVMYRQTPFNDKLPYTYNPSNVNVAEDKSEFEQGFTVKSLGLGEMGDTLHMVANGTIGSSQSITNLNTGQIMRQHYNVQQTINNLAFQNTIALRRQNVFDNKFKLKNKFINEYEGQNIHQVVSTGTYGKFKSYHDEFEEERHLKKLESASIKDLLVKNMMSITVPGTAFFLGKAAVGDTVNLSIVNDNLEVGKQSNADDMLDKNKSGKHLIYDLRHTFRGTEHEVTMNVCKLERES